MLCFISENWLLRHIRGMVFGLVEVQMLRILLNVPARSNMGGRWINNKKVALESFNTFLKHVALTKYSLALRSSDVPMSFNINSFLKSRKHLRDNIHVCVIQIIYLAKQSWANSL